MLEKTRSRSLIEKIKKPPKKRKPIAARSKFKAHGADPTKQYRRLFTDYQVIIRANIARQARLRNPTPAELRFAEILTAFGIEFEREKIFQNGDRWILADFCIEKSKLIIEIDGEKLHKMQEKYDESRSKWLETKGYKVIRFGNKIVLKQSVVILHVLMAHIPSIIPDISIA